MEELVRCHAMESLCRQRATFYPEESWKWFAEAEMWNHKAFECLSQPEASRATPSERSSVSEEVFSSELLPPQRNAAKSSGSAYLSKTTEEARKPSDGLVAIPGSKKDTSWLPHPTQAISLKCSMTKANAV